MLLRFDCNQQLEREVLLQLPVQQVLYVLSFLCTYYLVRAAVVGC